MTKYVPDAEDIVAEMIERTDSMAYMLDALRKEINLLPQLTGLDDVFFNSLSNCLNTAELVNYSNLEKLRRDESVINTENAPIKQSQKQIVRAA